MSAAFAVRVPSDKSCYSCVSSRTCAAGKRTDCMPCTTVILQELFMQILFQGPHVKMGVYRGRPTGVSPHVTTGRADYFGPFVNRCA